MKSPVALRTWHQGPDLAHRLGIEYPRSRNIQGNNTWAGRGLDITGMNIVLKRHSSKTEKTKRSYIFLQLFPSAPNHTIYAHHRQQKIAMCCLENWIKSKLFLLIRHLSGNAASMCSRSGKLPLAALDNKLGDASQSKSIFLWLCLIILKSS